MVRCPGQDLRFWKLGDIFDVPCPHCGMAVEFWRDEPSVKCPQCRAVIINPKLDLGCAQWCQHAEQCLGAVIDPESLLCKKLIKEMKNALGSDERRINHSLAVFRNAQQILAGEPADARIVNAAAILHTLAAPCPPPAECPAERRELSTVRAILTTCGVDAEQIESVCQLVASHGSGHVEDSMEARILGDAERLTRLADHSAGAAPIEIRESILRKLQTQKGRELARMLTDSAQKSPEQAE
jgi:HD superfamily phosphodiesterase